MMSGHSRSQASLDGPQGRRDQPTQRHRPTGNLTTRHSLKAGSGSTAPRSAPPHGQKPSGKGTGQSGKPTQTVPARPEPGAVIGVTTDLFPRTQGPHLGLRRQQKTLGRWWLPP